MADIQSLKRDINNIVERADNTIYFEKLTEFKEGVEQIKATYEDTYTTDALNETIDEYKHSKFDEITHELAKFDEESQNLLDKAYTRVSHMQSELSTAIDPSSQYELEKHNYILNKLQNELSNTFTDYNPSAQDLNEVLNQAQHNKLYANALLQTKSLLINNINNNSNIADTQKSVLKNNLEKELKKIKDSILPKEYDEFQELKEQLDNSQLAARNKTGMFKFMLEMNNEEIAKVR